MLTHTDKNECICNHIEFIEYTEEKTNDKSRSNRRTESKKRTL